MSFTAFVQHAGLTYWLRCMQRNMKIREEDDRKVQQFFLIIENYIIQCLNNKHLFTSLPPSRAPKHSKIELQTYENNQWTVLWYRPGIELNSCNNLANLVKVSVSVKSIIPCIYPQNSWSCLRLQENIISSTVTEEHNFNTVSISLKSLWTLQKQKLEKFLFLIL